MSRACFPAVALSCAGAAALGGCATPAERIDRFAADAELQRSIVRGAAFEHVVYGNGRRFAGATVHVYLEGDGRPYLDRWTVAPDPTPRRPLMLHLLASDPAPAVYVGRPCYHGLSPPPCNPLHWTLQRFGPEVVDSMVAAIAAATAGAESVELYAHSGGAVFAVHAARRLDHVTRVVTLAGNVDPAAWTRWHGYTSFSPLVDPLAAGPLRPSVTQLHAVGADDRNVPPSLVREGAARLGATDVRVIRGADHACCWQDLWPALRDGIVAAPDGV